jgi:excisionase family DNA binding protein
MKARPLSEDYERLLAVSQVLSDRQSTMEQKVAELCAAVGVAPPPPPMKAEFMTVKHVMAVTGYSQSNVRKLIKNKKLTAVKRGGRVLISAASVAALGAKKLGVNTEGRAA